MMTIVARFTALYGVPEFVVPYLACFVSQSDMDLVVQMDGRKCSVAEVAEKMGCSWEQAEMLLQDGYTKGIVHRELCGQEWVYWGADFYERLDYLCKFDESYKLAINNLDIYSNSGLDSNALLKELDAWCYQVYAERMTPYLEQLKHKERVDRAPEMFFQLEDLEDLLNSVSEIRLVPCNCRKLAERCAKPTETCLSFDGMITDRTFGRVLSKDEAREIVKTSHGKGLMHQVNSDWRRNGPSYMCNCCSCCCYPTRLAQEKGTKGFFPVISKVAVRDTAKCSHCGVCAKRCNFAAFYPGEAETEVNGKLRQTIEFNQSKCWGCGICVESCATKAISMVELT